MMDHEHAPHNEDLQKKRELEKHEVTEVIGFLKRYGKLIGAGLLAAVVTVLVSRVYTHQKAASLAKAE
ncbi:MAG: hypothetical protein WC334_09625, partial [Kiritimatiellales bacterium]